MRKLLKFGEFSSFIDDLNEARKPKKDPRSDIPQELYDEADKRKKGDQFRKFITLLPTDALKNIDLVWKKILSNPKNIKDFFDRIYEYKSVKEISQGDYSNGIGSDLFMAEPKGLGRGELFIAWLVEDAEISGGGESFDVKYKKEKYEVKEYSSGNDSIRLGTKGKITRFEFWREIVDTLRRLDKLTGFSSGQVKFDFSNYFDSEFARVTNDILQVQDKWLGGELGKEDFSKLQEFYEMANKIESKTDKDLITNVIFRGPDAKPKEISIEPISTKDLDSGKITVNKTPEDHSYTYILTELRRLKYVRDPKALLSDIQDTIDNKIISDVPFFVFRPDGPHIETEFKYDRISQNGIKIIEARLAK